MCTASAQQSKKETSGKQAKRQPRWIAKLCPKIRTDKLNSKGPEELSILCWGGHYYKYTKNILRNPVLTKIYPKNPILTIKAPCNTLADTSPKSETLNWELGLGGTLGEIDPLNKAPCKRATSRVKKGPHLRVSLILPRKTLGQCRAAAPS